MFADMGIQPTTLDASLLLATQSTDFTKPTSTITSPSLARASWRARVSPSPEPLDLGGGVIAGIEVSVDGGLTWFKARAGRAGPTLERAGEWHLQIKSRAVDDSLNMETPRPASRSRSTCRPIPSIWTLADSRRSR